MIRTIVDVIRGEGLASAGRRAAERLGEALRFERDDAGAPLVNVPVGGRAPRTGGVAVQLMFRLREERKLRAVSLRPHAAMRAVHFEGTSALDVDDALRLIDRGVDVVVSVHDFTLLGRPRAEELLGRAKGVIFPSHYLMQQYRRDAVVIEPGIPRVELRVGDDRGGIAFAGGVKPHKGGHLLAGVARRLDRTLHVFGGGDRALLEPLRRLPNVRVHGYYRAGTLPRLLARHRIGLVLLPSVVPESFSLVMSEAWAAGACVAAFDLGAQAERIRAGGGGWLAPLESGADGIVDVIRNWTAPCPPRPARTPMDAAREHVEAYRRWGLPG